MERPLNDHIIWSLSGEVASWIISSLEDNIIDYQKELDEGLGTAGFPIDEEHRAELKRWIAKDKKIVAQLEKQASVHFKEVKL